LWDVAAQSLADRLAASEEALEGSEAAEGSAAARADSMAVVAGSTVAEVDSMAVAVATAAGTGNFARFATEKRNGWQPPLPAVLLFGDLESWNPVS